MKRVKLIEPPKNRRPLVYDEKQAKENFRRHHLSGFRGKVFAAVAWGETDALVEHLQRHRLTMRQQQELIWPIEKLKRYPRGHPAGGLTWHKNKKGKLDQAKQYAKTLAWFGNQTYEAASGKRVSETVNAELYRAAINLVKKILPGQLGEYDILVKDDPWKVTETMCWYLIECEPAAVQQMEELGLTLAAKGR